MPVYPCINCNSQVDLRDIACRNCSEAKPFKCTKCETKMAADDIYQLETVTFQKPLFCQTCGAETSVVSCHRCGLNVFRSDAVERMRDDRLIFFHIKCEELNAKQRKVSQLATNVLTPVLGLFGILYWWPQGNVKAIIGGAGCALIGLIIGRITQPRGG